MFESATLRLTGIYLAILASICVLFSVIVFNVASQRLDRRVQNPPGQILRRLPQVNQNELTDFFAEQAAADKLALRNRLILLDAAVIVLGGVASYALARRTLKPIEAAHDAQKRFAADAAHELRTPLASMQTETQVALRNKKLTKTQAIEQLQSNLDEVQHLTALTAGLLQLTRNESSVGLQETVDLLTIAKDAQLQADSAKVKVSGGSVTVNGDKNLLQQAVSELVANARKHASGSPIEIQVSREGKRAVLAVADQGEGLSDSELQKVFSRLHRGQNAVSNQTDGFGLGLPLVKQIVQHHGGTITAHHNSPTGLKVIVSLPVV